MAEILIAGMLDLDTLLYNSYLEGGLLYVGDMHGGQGDTEFTGIADETRATIRLSCRVIKNKKIRVFIIKPMPLADKFTMEHAVDACWNIMDWLKDSIRFHKDVYKDVMYQQD